MSEEKEVKGQVEDASGKCICSRCGKRMMAINFYSYRDGSKLEVCKPCLTAHIDNFDPETFEWILEKIDVPYLPIEWNKIRDKVFAKNPKKAVGGASVIGKYLAKMRIRQWSKARYADSERLQKEMEEDAKREQQAERKTKEEYQAELKQKLDKGEISLAEYQTLVSTDTQYREMKQQLNNSREDLVNGKNRSNIFNEENFLSEEELTDFGAQLSHQDKVYLALKWGRLYSPNQWVALEQLYNEFMNSFDIQGAARIDTLKMICKTSLKMNEAIDVGDIESYQRLSRVYDTMMKSAKFTQAQNKEGEDGKMDSVSSIVDFVEANTGAIPRYVCDEPQDIVDQIILDLKQYTKNLIYEDKSLAQEIEKYLQDKRIAEEMRRNQKEARAKGLDYVELNDQDYVDFKENMEKMKQHDKQLQKKLSEGVEQQ